MKKTLKIISISAVSLILILVLIPFVIVFFVNPNDYKPEISQLVEDNIGRELTFNGDINFSVFPWVGLSLGELFLSNSNAPGFSKTAFAKIKSADVHIKLMPLFSSKIEIDKITLAGLALSLEKNKQGIGNWQDLSAKKAAKSPSTTTQNTPTPDTASSSPEAADSPKAFILPAIAGIELVDANINWNDKQLNQQYQLKNFNFTTGKIANDTPTNISIDFSVSASEPKLSATTQLTAQLLFNIDNMSIQISQLELTENLTQQIAAPEKIKLKLTADKIKANLNTQTASVSNLKLSALGLDVTLSLTAKNILSNLAANGSLTSNQLNPKELLDTLKITLPKMADANVLSSAKLDLKFNAKLNKENPNLDSVALSNINVKFDDSNLQGNVAVTNFSKPKLRYKLNLDSIDVDRYLPPPVKKAKATSTTSNTATAKVTPIEEDLPIPVELLRSLDIKGSFTLGDITVAKLKAKKLQLTITAKDANIRLNPISANMYQGQYRGDVTLNVKHDQPLIKMQHKVSGVEFKPLALVFMGKDYFSGNGTATAKLNTKGKKISEFTKNLNGLVAFNINNAKLKYLKPLDVISNKAQEEIAKLFKKSFKKKPEGTDNPDVFKVMKGTLKITNGVARNDDFYTESRNVNLTGKGIVNLVKKTVKYTIKMHLVKPKTGDAGFDEYLTRNTINNSIYGPFDNLSYNNFNILKLVENYGSELGKKIIAKEKKKLEQKLKNKAEIEKKKLEQKLKKKADAEKKKIAENIKKKLGNLFK